MGMGKCTAGWILVGLSFVLLAMQGNVGLMAVLVVLSLVFACGVVRPWNHTTKLTPGAEKR